MRKCMTMLLLLALLCFPGAAQGEGLQDLFTAVYDGVGEGLETGVTAALSAMGEELTVDLAAQDGRIETGKTLSLTITAGNPRPQETEVSFVLSLPERLAAAPDTVWTAVLPAAQADPQTGALMPSETVFTREIALLPGGESETVDITCEMSMGTRFYRAQTALALCVPDVRVSAAIEGDRAGRLYPGDAYAYRIEVTNGGAASKDVALEMILPEGVSLTQPLPEGFALEHQTIRGTVRAEAAAADEKGAVPSVKLIVLPVCVEESALEGDMDANRLMTGVLRADGERVPLPRIQVCGARIRAKLTADSEELKAGEETKLRVVVVNAGLAPAHVQVSCALPDGLTLAAAEEKEEAQKTHAQKTVEEEKEATPGELTATADEMDPPAGGEAQAALAAAAAAEDGMLVFDLHMEAAKETDKGITAHTQTIEIPVRAEAAQENLNSRLVGATLAWTVDGGKAQLGEAVAMRVTGAEFMGISADDWNGVFWASVLLLITLACLCAAVRKEKREEDYCLD